MKTKKADWNAYSKLIQRANVPFLVLLGYFLVQLVYSRISTDLIPFASKIYTGEILDAAQIGQYVLLVAIMIIIWLVQCLFQYWFTFRTDRQFQLITWKSMIHMPMTSLERQNVATLPSRVTSDSTKLSMQFLQVIGTLTSVYTIYVTLSNVRKDSAFMAGFMLKMLLVVFIWIILSSGICGRFKFRASLRFQETYARFTDYITERLSNISLIKSSAAEEAEAVRAVEEIDSQYHAEIYQINIEYISTFVTQSCMYIFQALVLFAGAMMIRSGTLDQSGMLTAYRYSLTLPVYLTTIVTAYLTVKESQGCAARISEIVTAESESYQRKKSFAMEDADISFENVTFRYGDKMGLHNASFTIPANRVTAIVGPNGSGKSTAVSLIERFYLPETGCLRFGNCPVEDIHLDEWRRSIGYIAQNTTLISGTLRENLVYALHRPTDENELHHVLRAANMEAFVAGLPDGLDTDLGELGEKLSGGERQRIGIARIILRNPEYLILDEVTSALDAENKAVVMSALRELMTGRTCVLISHDMDDVVLGADHIVVLDEGNVQAEGDCNQIVKNNAYFANCRTAMCQ